MMMNMLILIVASTLAVLFFAWFLTVDTLTNKWLDARAARKAAAK